MEVQFSSVSRFSSLGAPYSRKPFDYNIEMGENISETDTYLSRLAQSRKNYLNTWLYTPYLYNRSANWFKPNLVSLINNKNLNYPQLRALLNHTQNLQTTTLFFSTFNEKFNPTFSSINTYAKSFWRPYSSSQSYYYTMTTLIDFLTKREFIYRNYLELNNKLIQTPTEILSTPTNPLISEIESVFNFNEPTTFSTEYSREVYYNSLEFFQYNTIRNLLSSTQNLPINVSFMNDFFFYLFGTKVSSKNGNMLELYKNPHRPLKKGITNMLRLHATGAVALPIELRLQILASSRDVIHSWSVPSAGVKIDCVPGYTSHKIMMFLMEGIYWGQCMEICGRYHHWMPIVAYFMRRDLFFLWCTHFIFNPQSSKLWDINDRQYTNYLRYVTFNKTQWLLDIEENL